MTHSNLTTPHLSLHRRRFLQSAAVLGAAGAFPSILRNPALAADWDLPVPKQHYVIAFFQRRYEQLLARRIHQLDGAVGRSSNRSGRAFDYVGRAGPRI